MKALAVLLGMFLWAATALLAYLAGVWLFSGGAVTLAAYAAVLPLVWLMLAGFFRITLVAPGDRLAAAALIVLPGLIMNAGLAVIEPIVFAWPEPVARVLGSWLMWTYAATIVVAAHADRSGEARHRGS